MERTVGRLVCNVQEPSPSPVLLSGARPSSVGNGRDAPGLVRPGGICLSSVQFSEGSHKQVQDFPSGTSVGLSMAPSTEERYAQKTSFQPASSRFVHCRSDRLQTVWKFVRAKGFSREFANAIARCRRESSSKLYQAKWPVIHRWCK